jgi:hypothetical protein
MTALVSTASNAFVPTVHSDEDWVVRSICAREIAPLPAVASVEEMRALTATLTSRVWHRHAHDLQGIII